MKHPQNNLPYLLGPPEGLPRLHRSDTSQASEVLEADVEIPQVELQIVPDARQHPTKVTC